MKRILVAMLLVSCSRQPQTPCAKELAALEDGNAFFVHGLTNDDDLRAAMDRFDAAEACVPEMQAGPVGAQARLLSLRLGVTGNYAALKRLMEVSGRHRSMDLKVLENQLALQQAKMARSVAERLTARAEALVKENNDARTSLAKEAWQGIVAPQPATTQVIVNFADEDESCVTAWLGQNLGSGLATLTLSRAGQKIALHGDPPALTLPATSPKATRVKLCASGLLIEGDVLDVHMGPTLKFTTPLHIDMDALARGRVVALMGGVVRPATRCQGPLGLDGQAACRFNALTVPP